MKLFVRNISAIIFSLIAFQGAFAADQRTFSKINADEAQVKIKTEQTEGVQAAAYVDAVENPQYIEMMLADSASQLAVLSEKIKKEQCDEFDPDCGDVRVTPYVLTAFNRGGWQEGHGEYTFFVGFQVRGTGHEFTSQYFVVMGEDALADVDDNDEYLGTITKNLKLIRILAIP